MKADLREFEKFSLDKMRETLIPSISVSLIEDGEAVYSRAFGFRDKNAGIAATPRTLYGIGSVTKSFTCLAIEQLEEEGKLSSNDPVSKHLPSGFRAFQEDVKIHHLMSHSSGLPGLGYAEAFLGGALGYDDAWLPVSSAKDLMTFMADARDWTEAKPGDKFFYLNEGYSLLGEIISKASGLPYEDYLKKKIFSPLGMTRTFLSKKDVESEPDRATPYITTKEKKLVESVYPYGIFADGGIVSNVVDLTTYLRMYLGRGVLNGKRILSEAGIKRMETPYIKYPYGLFAGQAYGYGLFIVPDFFGEELIQHSGSVGVFTAFIGYLPRLKAGVAMLSNSSGYPLGDIAMYALASLIGKDPNEFPFVKHENYLKKLEGRYDTYKGAYKAEVKASGDFLIFRIVSKIEESEMVFVPDKLSEDKALFSTSVRKRKYTLEFRVKSDGIELIFERYKFRKIGT